MEILFHFQSRQDSFMKRFSTRHGGGAMLSDDDSIANETLEQTQIRVGKERRTIWQYYLILLVFVRIV